MVIDELPGFLVFEVTGKDVAVFSNEGGGHRWQRVPPTEKRGRVHTSTVTVAVMDTSSVEVVLDSREVDIRTERGSGPGGQHRNVTDSCVVVTHRPTGVQARVDGRSQHQNREAALRVLACRLAEQQAADLARVHNNDRQRQVGSGMRGDKIRTYREQDDQVIDHRTGQRWSLRRWRAGTW